MSEKRKDSKGRLLKVGESQRKDGSYEYRFMDADGKRKSVYAQTLNELRQKEEDVKKSLGEGIAYKGGNISVIDLINKYISLKRNTRENTKRVHSFVLGVVGKYPIGQARISDINMSDAKLWLIRLHDDGYSYNTIVSICGVLRPAFEMAYNEYLIRRNPFRFKIDMIPKDKNGRNALTPIEQQRLLDFIEKDRYYSRYLDEVVILLNTGMRVSELCGLTLSDIDFVNRKINVERQLLVNRKGERYIERPKTTAGVRQIPMLPKVYDAFKNMVFKRDTPPVEMMVDGVAGFLMLDIYGKPKMSFHIDKIFSRMIEKLNEKYDANLPKVTPHVLRHTFCTNMVDAGMEIKNLQYLMGHADAQTTLNVYSHNSYEKAEESFFRVMNVF